MSSSVLNQRLGELREADIVELTTEGFGLTDEGRSLLEALSPINTWADRWARRTAGPSRRSAA